MTILLISSSKLLMWVRLDIPVYFVMGLRDTLIEPVSVMAHYDTLLDARPDLANLKALLLPFFRVGLQSY